MNFFSEVVHALNDHEVRFMVFGGFAVNYYGFNRYTADLDIWVDPDEKNLESLRKSVTALGYESSETLEAFLSKKAILLRMMDKNYKVDFLQKINIKKSFSDCYADAEFSKTPFGNIHFISYHDLLEEKILTHRPKDLLDVKELKLLRNE